jgi:transposase-like protein
MTKRRTFTPEFKAQVILEILSGAKSMPAACREYQIHSQVINRWKSQFLTQASIVFEKNSSHQNERQQRIAELERMVGRLTMELETVKKGSCGFD